MPGAWRAWVPDWARRCRRRPDRLWPALLIFAARLIQRQLDPHEAVPTVAGQIGRPGDGKRDVDMMIHC